MKTKTASWKPQRKGAIYCSPACGRGCTWEEYKKAKVAAAGLAKELGKGWKPHVWENLGWYFEAVDASGRLKVSRALFSHNYIAFLGDPGPGGRWVGKGRTPNAAVKRAIGLARLELAALKTIISIVENGPGKRAVKRA